jgi:hypothetical protein
MRPRCLALWLAALLLAAPLLLAPARAQEVVIAQSSGQSSTLDLAAIRRLPAVTVRVSFLTGHGPEQARYTGARLWAVLQQAGVLGTDPRARVRQVVAVTGRDGYVAVLALAEIDPEFEGKQVLLATQRDGRPLDRQELRLVVPGDRRGGRSVRDVVRIELR